MPQKTTPMKTFSTLFFSLLSYVMFSQNTVTGIVLDTKKTPLTGANVYIDGTYDGGLTDAQGRFTFTTTASGLQKIVVSLLGYESVELPYTVGEEQLLQITLKESVNTLDTVVITAGTFDAGERSRVSVLKPLDIVTTAGSNGNIIAALQTLPGTQNVAEDGRLFVRGGEAMKPKPTSMVFGSRNPMAPQLKMFPPEVVFLHFCLQACPFLPEDTRPNTGRRFRVYCYSTPKRKKSPNEQICRL